MYHCTNPDVILYKFKVAPYSFSAREEWELNWHKRAHEECDSPSQMTCANQPPSELFQSLIEASLWLTFSKPVEHIAVKL